MKKFSCLALLTCFLIILSGTAFAWSDRSEGRPHPHHPPNLSVWHDANEFHVKTLNLRSHHVFSGVIRTDGRFYDIEETNLENGDFIFSARRPLPKSSLLALARAKEGEGDEWPFLGIC